MHPATFERSRERGLSPCEHEGALFPPPTQGNSVSNVKLVPRATTSPSLPPWDSPSQGSLTCFSEPLCHMQGRGTSPAGTAVLGAVLEKGRGAGAGQSPEAILRVGAGVGGGAGLSGS